MSVENLLARDVFGLRAWLTFTAVRTEAGICFRSAPVGSTEDLNNCFQMLLLRFCDWGHVDGPWNKLFPALFSTFSELLMLADFCLLVYTSEFKLAARLQFYLSTVRIGFLLCFSEMNGSWLLSRFIFDGIKWRFNRWLPLKRSVFNFWTFAANQISVFLLLGLEKFCNYLPDINLQTFLDRYFHLFFI